MTPLILLAATLSATMAAGLFYAYSCSVNPGLGRLNDTAYLQAMQSINRAILNPVFFLTFLGTVVLLPLAVWCTWRPHPGTATWCFLAAAILYIIGVFGVTIGGNVPLNDALDKFNIASATSETITQQRLAFETAWNRFHSIRSIASVFSAAAAILGCLTYPR